MPYPQFDRSLLKLEPLSKRRNLLSLADWLELGDPVPPFENDHLFAIAAEIIEARRSGRPVILMAGAHLLRAGVSRHIIRLLEQGLITHVALNGAGPIHDFELALIGATTESVAEYISEGQFGLWTETGRLNDIIRKGVEDNLGLGEAVGKSIQEGDFPNKSLSVLAAGYRLRIPVTVHVGIGYDIIHEHPSCDGAAIGRASYTDFLVFAETVRKLEGGVLLAFGSAVMAPEVYLKALAMARNVARQEGAVIRHFTTAVFDLAPLDQVDHEPVRGDFQYYYRPLKTILVRTVKDGGRSYYVRGDHRATFPNLHRILQEKLHERP